MWLQQKTEALGMCLARHQLTTPIQLKYPQREGGRTINLQFPENTLSLNPSKLYHTHTHTLAPTGLCLSWLCKRLFLTDFHFFTQSREHLSFSLTFSAVLKQTFKLCSKTRELPTYINRCLRRSKTHTPWMQRLDV